MILIQTGYKPEAFGVFQPHKDPDAAVKFCLDALAMNHDFSRLIRLLSDERDFDGIGGVPGWALDRWREGDRNYEQQNWPPGAAFRASVDPDDYELAFPEGFYTASAFAGFVRAILRAYVARHPGRADEAERVEALLAK